MRQFLQRFLTFRTPTDIESKQVVSNEQKQHWPVTMAEMLPLLIVLGCLSVALYFVLAPRRVVPVQPPVITMIRPEGQVTGRNELSGGGLLVGHAEEGAGMIPSSSLPRDEDVASTSDTEPVVITPRGNHTVVRNKDQRCGVKAHFTRCSSDNQMDKFFFQADEHSCVSLTAVPPPPCLVGSNRFRSMHDCKKACNDQPVPQEKCSFPAEFHTCTPSDISRNWYFVRNGTCVAWHFRGGNCVSPRLPLFRSEEDCRTLCLGGRASERRPACSDSPVEHVCSPLHMRFPVYSVSRGHHKISCVTVDTAEPRCLSGTNRFRSKRECEQACLQ
ncbi:papilin-like [Ornithodoros turicata]|uniref:papilin-like n=1 Tax=Ornithodoros turicata TaxID=34597 RepID=UPI003139ACF7